MDDIARALDAPIARLACPPRLRWVIEARGIETIRELVALSPDDVRRMRRCGKRTVEDTDRALRALVGAGWREMHAMTAPPAPRKHLDTPLAALPTPSRLKWLVAARALVTLRDLARLGAKDVLATRSCGVGTLAAVESTIQGALGVSWEEARALAAAEMPSLEPDWRLTVARLVGELEAETERAIVARRLGVNAAPEPAGEIARALRLSPRRVRSVERLALERMAQDPRVAAARARLRAAVAGGVVPLAEVGARDAYFAAAPEQEAALALFVDLVLRDATGTRRVAGHVLVSALGPAEIAWRLERLREAARRASNVAFPEERLARLLGWTVALTRDLAALAAKVPR